MDKLILSTVLLQGLILISLGAALYHVFKQQGRLLLRLDTIEERMGLLRGQNEQAESAGLVPGTPFSSFQLPNLEGQMVGLEAFQGKRTLLIHWSPNCGFCVSIAAELAGLQAALYSSAKA